MAQQLHRAQPSAGRVDAITRPVHARRRRHCPAGRAAPAAALGWPGAALGATVHQLRLLLLALQVARELGVAAPLPTQDLLLAEQQAAAQQGAVRRAQQAALGTPLSATAISAPQPFSPLPAQEPAAPFGGHMPAAAQGQQEAAAHLPYQRW